MTSACRPLTAWRHLAALLCAVALFVPGPAGAQPCGTCARTSLGLAPRAYPAGDAPVAAAAGDLDGDGRADLVVANNPPLAGQVRVLLGGPSGFVLAGTYPQSPVPRGIAIADFDTDGIPDVVVALSDGGAGLVQVLRNTGGGNLNPVPLVSRSAGLNTSAVVVGDFDGNGTPDVAATSEGSSQVFVFLGDGNGGLDSGHITPVGASSSPRALVAGFFDAGGILDLAVACASEDRVRVLRGRDGGNGKGDGTFTTGPVLDVNPAPGVDEPTSVAAADLELDGDLDIVTANRSSATVSVFKNDGTGGFALVLTPVVGGNPSGVAVLPVDATSRPDIVTSNPGSQSVDLLLDDGVGGFVPATHHVVLLSPQAVVPVDADADGRRDLAVPCRASDAVAVLISRPPGPPALSAAVRYPVGSQPAAAVAADLDGVNGLDLAVANEADSTVSILLNNGAGSFAPFGVPRSVLSTPSAIVAGDFDGDTIPDLAVSSTIANKVSVLRGTGGGNFAAVLSFDAGSGPDDLVAADVEGDGDLDLLVCNRVSVGTVVFLRNTSTAGAISFAQGGSFAVGPDPTSIFAGRLDANSTVDFVVANSTATKLTILHGDGTGNFDDLTPEILNLTGGDANPTAVTGADFDGDGDIDLAATVLNGSAVSVFQNGGTSFTQPPARIPATDLAVHATAADLNLDGKIDLAIAAQGLEVLRGRGSVAAFEEGEDFVAGLWPSHVVVKDLSGDGRPDMAVVNRDSNDVSILLGTGCAARRLEVTQQPAEAACLTGLGPYNVQAVVAARDDGGNLACPAGDVTATIVPGTGTGGASLTGTVNSPPRVPLVSGFASFTGTTDSLTIDTAGRRYRLQFSALSLPGVAPAISHSFTLGAQPVILGPTSFCPGAQATYAADPAEGSYDEYRWTLDAAPSPFAFAPSIVLKEPPTLSEGAHTLALEARVDSCTLSATPRTIWYDEWQNTSLSTPGATTVCVDCLGGTVKPTDEGGGAVSSRQWGYRTVTGGTVTPIVGETAETYVVKGTDFPGPGTYYLVVTTGFACIETTPPNVSFELSIVVTAEVDTSEVQFLAVTSRGSSSTGEHLLQWVNATGSPDEICIRWNEAPDSSSDCVFPIVPDCPSPDGPNWHRILGAAPNSWSHTGVTLDRNYCYAVFVRDDGNVPPWSPGRVVRARAFNTDVGPVKWAYSTGATAVVPPVVGKFGILAMSNDRTVHAVTRGSTGGIWPGGWTPQALSGVVHTRSPIVPFGSGLVTVGDKSVLFVADDTGAAQAVDALTGQALWGALGSDPSAGAATATGAPGAILQQYAGVRDLVLVGTRNKTPLTSASELFGLNPSSGSTVIAFDGGGTLGPVLGSPAVDYSTQRVYFASRQFNSGPTVWCLEVSASDPALSPCSGWTNPSLGNFDTSPVLRNGRLYVANDTVYSLDAADGGSARTFPTGDGLVKGFVFPDRASNDLFFASNTKVWSVPDNCTSPCTMSPNWVWTDEPSPSLVLFWREQRYLYVGGSNGRLWQLNLSFSPGHPSFATSLTLGDGRGQIGAPTLDIGVAPRLLVVGSESGVLYGVEVPF